jgi:hypothetical protein
VCVGAIGRAIIISSSISATKSILAFGSCRSMS